MGICKGWWPNAESLACLTNSGFVAGITDAATDEDAEAPPAASSSSSSAAQQKDATDMSEPVQDNPSSEAHPGPKRRKVQKGAAVDLMASSVDGGKSVVATSQMDIQHAKRDAKHYLHFVANVLSNPVTLGVARAAHVVCRPVVEYLQRMKTICSTERGSVQWHADAVNGALGDVLGCCYKQLLDESAFQGVGFMSCTDEYLNDAEGKNDSFLADVVHCMLSNLTAECWTSDLNWTERYPGKILGLAADRAGVRQTVLRSMQLDFEALMQLCEQCGETPAFQKVLRELQWPCQTYTME
eukprot:2282749-Amphidinium_carterae.1